MFGGGVLIVVVAAALAAPLVSRAEVAGQPDIVAERFLPPLATDPRTDQASATRPARTCPPSGPRE